MYDFIALITSFGFIFLSCFDIYFRTDHNSKQFYINLTFSLELSGENASYDSDLFYLLSKDNSFCSSAIYQ